jgi:uncharacterized protein (TIGR02757 family)
MLSELLLAEIKAFLDEKVSEFNRPEFIEFDPISIPHCFDIKEDIEVSGLLSATIAWGNRKIIIQNAKKLIKMLGGSPYDFVMYASDKQINSLKFTHRTFNSTDLVVFIYALRNVYMNHGGLQNLFERYAMHSTLQPAISAFKKVFFEIEHPIRVEKHVSDPLNGSAAKRLNMMLRWFVRKDTRGVDFGIWNGILKPSQLSIPLDIHTGTIAREFGLLNRKQNDAKAVAELDLILRKFDSIDPVKYDFALFGLGVSNQS